MSNHFVMVGSTKVVYTDKDVVTKTYEEAQALVDEEAAVHQAVWDAYSPERKHQEEAAGNFRPPAAAPLPSG